jgi:hypothetical protein
VKLVNWFSNIAVENLGICVETTKAHFSAGKDSIVLHIWLRPCALLALQCSSGLCRSRLFYGRRKRGLLVEEHDFALILFDTWVKKGPPCLQKHKFGFFSENRRASISAHAMALPHPLAGLRVIELGGLAPG